MKNGMWLKETGRLLQDIPKEMLAAWEKKHPGANAHETWRIIKRWQKIGNYAVVGVCIFFCLAVILMVTESPKSEMEPSFILLGVSFVLLIIADFRLIGPESRIDDLMRSVATLKRYGLVPREGLRHDGLDEISEYAKIRLTENAFLVRNAEVGLQSFKKPPPVVAVAIASESIVVFKDRLNRALASAVEFGLSSGSMDSYFHDAEERIMRD
ncbi:MAG: hypothetical protein Q7S05_03035 [bacterium]|nr:hypothetical protein [bacterium]